MNQEMSRRASAGRAKATAPVSPRETDPNTQTILSVLKTYPSNEVAIVGCHTALNQPQELRVRPAGRQPRSHASEVRPRRRVLREDNLQV